MADQGLRRLSCRQEVPVRRLAEEQELRTLTFGDRTISYDTGLNCVPKYGEQSSNIVLVMFMGIFLFIASYLLQTNVQ